MDEIRQAIHTKIVELARELGRDARRLRCDGEIPASGLLDSPALMELVVWCEDKFGIEIDQEQLTLDNFGTIDAMAAYLESTRK